METIDLHAGAVAVAEDVLTRAHRFPGSASAAKERLAQALADYRTIRDKGADSLPLAGWIIAGVGVREAALSAAELLIRAVAEERGEDAGRFVRGVGRVAVA